MKMQILGFDVCHSAHWKHPVPCEFETMAGLLAYGFAHIARLPGRRDQWHMGACSPHTVAGAAAAKVPCWVDRSAFPFHPLSLLGSAEPSPMALRQTTDDCKPITDVGGARSDAAHLTHGLPRFRRARRKAGPASRRRWPRRRLRPIARWPAPSHRRFRVPRR